MGTHIHGLGSTFLVVLLSGAMARAIGLPEKPANVIKSSFPEASVVKVGRGRERGVWYYDVSLRDGKRRFEVAITADGMIGEIEGEVRFADLPPGLQQQVRARVSRGRVVRVEKHERRGVGRSGKFVSLSKARISYEIKYYNALGERRDLQLSSNEVIELPPKVRFMLAKRFPKASIEEDEVEDDGGVFLHVLSLSQDGNRFTVVASSQGDLVEYEMLIEPHALPKAARDLLEQDTDWRHARKPRVVVWETFSAVEQGKLVSRRDRTYMATLSRNGEVKEYRFDGRGRLTGKTDWAPGADDGASGDDGNDDE